VGGARGRYRFDPGTVSGGEHPGRTLILRGFQAEFGLIEKKSMN